MNTLEDDGFIEADFIGGVWDGKKYPVPNVGVWKVAILPIPAERFVGKKPKELLHYDIAIYRNVGHGIFWLSRIEKADE